MGQVLVGWARRSEFRATLALAVIVVSAGPVLASGILMTGTVVTVRATAGTDSGVLSYFLPANTSITGEYQWSPQTIPATIMATNGTTVLGTLNSLQLVFDADPRVSVDFDVTSAGATTTFDIVSDTLSFDPITNPDAFSSASVTLADANNSGYAKLSGQFPTPWGINSAFEARYNTTVKWVDLIGPMTLTDAGATMLAEEGRPEPPPSMARETIPATVDRIQTEWKFSLTANDRAYGTGVFDFTPELATALLLLLGIGLVRRSR